jgi:hypothetical protein
MQMTKLSNAAMAAAAAMWGGPAHRDGALFRRQFL